MHSAELNSHEGKQWREPRAANFRLKSAADSQQPTFTAIFAGSRSAKTGFPAKHHYALRVGRSRPVKCNRMRGSIKNQHQRWSRAPARMPRQEREPKVAERCLQWYEDRL